MKEVPAHLPHRPNIRGQPQQQPKPVIEFDGVETSVYGVVVTCFSAIKRHFMGDWINGADDMVEVCNQDFSIMDCDSLWTMEPRPGLTGRGSDGWLAFMISCRVRGSADTRVILVLVNLDNTVGIVASYIQVLISIKSHIARAVQSSCPERSIDDAGIPRFACNQFHSFSSQVDTDYIMRIKTGKIQPVVCFVKCESCRPCEHKV